MEVLTVGSLFSGIGGFDLGLERAGMRTVWQCEIDPYAQRVLAKHWPDVLRVPDIRRVTVDTVPWVDVLAGGFPCQDLSYAGKGAGIAGARSGLWSEYARLIRELRPRYVVVENVPALLARGMERVLGDLAACGYDAEWDCIPAAAVGAPHRRDRVWIVAYANGGGQRENVADVREREPDADRGDSRDAAYANGEGEHDGPVDAEVGGAPQPVAGADGAGLEGHGGPDRRPGELAAAARRGPDRTGDVADADQERRGGRPRQLGPRRRGEPPHGGWWSAEPDVGRVAHGIPQRVDRLRSLGNALVPQIAEWLGQRILEHESARNLNVA